MSSTSSTKLKKSEKQSILNNALEVSKFLQQETTKRIKHYSGNISGMTKYIGNVQYRLQQNKTTLFIGVFTIILSIILITLFSLSQKEKGTNRYLNILTEYSNILTILVVFGLTFCVLYFMYYITTNRYPLGLTIKNIGFSLGLVIGITLFTYLVFFMFRSYQRITFLSIFVNIGLIIFSMYSLYIFLKIIFPQSHYITLLKSSVFLVPCMIIDYIIIPLLSFSKNIQNKYDYTYVILLVIQIVFLLFYFYYDRVLYMLYSYNGVVLLDSPNYLDSKHTLGNYENLHIPTSSSIKNKDQLNSSELSNFNYNYGIQAWIYIDNQSPNNITNTFTNILQYGENPIIEYNVETHTLRIKVKDKKNTKTVIYETNDLPIQTWNQFVINYTNGYIDIFINSVLVATSKGDIPYMKYDSVVSGETNGVHGGITNVLYFKSPMSKTMIDLYFRLFRHIKNPKL